jgi:hypothetical protein
MKSRFLPSTAAILGLAFGLEAQLFESTQTSQILTDGEGATLLDSRAMVTVTYQPYNEFADHVFYSVGNGLFFASTSTGWDVGRGGGKWRCMSESGYSYSYSYPG